MEYVIVITYVSSLCVIFLFSINQLHLTYHYLRGKKGEKNRQSETQSRAMGRWPRVTVQLPVYNEQYVVMRLIDAVCKLDYDRSLVEIQVLDDSDDITSSIIATHIGQYQLKGWNISRITRPNRIGYKAGALQYGLDQCEGEFIAIFDADFMPPPDFLKSTIPYFNPTIGMVQTRWGHLNKGYSFLTKLQAFGLDAHFTIEQGGRSNAGSYINFNGTGGVWRKECITDAGGWSADTLTEDLDLSYRAQLKGWKFTYLEDCVTPAELPVIMTAIKSQQYRWNKGAAETARKNLVRIFKSSLPASTKIHAFFHLFNSAVFIFLLLASLMSIPMLFIKANNSQYQFIFDMSSIFLVGFFSIALFYWVGSKQIQPKQTLKYFLSQFPLFITVFMGLSLHNAIAVIEGLIGRKTAFIRTPKFNIIGKAGVWSSNSYISNNMGNLTIVEAILSLYFALGVGIAFYLQEWGLIVFHLMLCMGFGIVFYHTLKATRYEAAS